MSAPAPYVGYYSLTFVGVTKKVQRAGPQLTSNMVGRIFKVDPTDMTLRPAGGDLIIFPAADGTFSLPSDEQDFVVEFLREAGTQSLDSAPRLAPIRRTVTGATQSSGGEAAATSLRPPPAAPVKPTEVRITVDLGEWRKNGSKIVPKDRRFKLVILTEGGLIEADEEHTGIAAWKRIVGPRTRFYAAPLPPKLEDSSDSDTDYVPKKKRSKKSRRSRTPTFSPRSASLLKELKTLTGGPSNAAPMVDDISDDSISVEFPSAPSMGVEVSTYRRSGLLTTGPFPNQGTESEVIGAYVPNLDSDPQVMGPRHRSRNQVSETQVIGPSAANEGSNLQAMGAPFPNQGAESEVIGPYVPNLGSDLQVIGPRHPSHNQESEPQVIGPYVPNLGSDLQVMGPRHPSHNQESEPQVIGPSVANQGSNLQVMGPRHPSHNQESEPQVIGPSVANQGSNLQAMGTAFPIQRPESGAIGPYVPNQGSDLQAIVPPLPNQGSESQDTGPSVANQDSNFHAPSLSPVLEAGVRPMHRGRVSAGLFAQAFGRQIEMAAGVSDLGAGPSSSASIQQPPKGCPICKAGCFNGEVQSFCTLCRRLFDKECLEIYLRDHPDRCPMCGAQDSFDTPVQFIDVKLHMD